MTFTKPVKVEHIVCSICLCFFLLLFVIYFNLQGFQVFADQGDGFGGITAEVMKHISDEYDKKTSMCFGITHSDILMDETCGLHNQARSFRQRMVNTALLWNAFNHHSSSFCPIGLSQNVFIPNPTFSFRDYKVCAKFNNLFCDFTITLLSQNLLWVPSLLPTNYFLYFLIILGNKRVLIVLGIFVAVFKSLRIQLYHCEYNEHTKLII